MRLEEIKAALRRKATGFITGGFRPGDGIGASWIGKVVAYRPEEGLPVDAHGKAMIPLAQIYLGELQNLPLSLQGLDLLTVFISPNGLPAPMETMGATFAIREYRSMEEVVFKKLSNPSTRIKTFPLQPVTIEEDYPVWDDGQMSMDLMDAIIALEDVGEIESYYDFAIHATMHKVGGYPSYCQSGRPFSQGYKFAFQITSDSKATFEVVDGGSLMFAKHETTGDWQVYYDFY